MAHVRSPNIEEAQRRIADWSDELECLDISNLNLTELPHNLPANLQYLRCDYNNLTTLPNNLPANLKELYCNDTRITSLPDTLPESLEILSCNFTLLTFLPETLPANLKGLYCNCTQLDSLPDKLPRHFVNPVWSYGLWCYKTNLPDKRQNESMLDYYTRIKRKERERVVERVRAIKEDLMAKTWHTSRVIDWCGENFEWG